jgi:hypothetical protein
MDDLFAEESEVVDGNPDGNVHHHSHTQGTAGILCSRLPVDERGIATPEKRKVGGSIPPLTTSSEQHRHPEPITAWAFFSRSCCPGLTQGPENPQSTGMVRL